MFLCQALKVSGATILRRSLDSYASLGSNSGQKMLRPGVLQGVRATTRYGKASIHRSIYTRNDICHSCRGSKGYRIGSRVSDIARLASMSEIGSRQSAIGSARSEASGWGYSGRGEAAQGWSMADPAFGVDRKSQLCSPGQSQARTHDDGRWNHIHTSVDVQPSMIDTIL